MNLPNKLTIFRIILVFIMILVPLFSIEGEFLSISIEFWIINSIFIIASITDKLDGTIARKTNQVTDFGKFLDPIADKILVISAMVLLVQYGTIPAWIPIIIIIREFVVSGFRLIAVEKNGKVIAANVWGKIKTVTQIIAIILAFININNTNVFFGFVHNDLSGISLVINICTSLLMVVCVIATIFSGITYLKGGKDLLKDC